MKDFFDNIYVLNLHHQKERMNISKKRLSFMNINKYERFGATNGKILTHVWNKLENSHFKNPNYLGCAISHLSIYQDALENKYKRILIIEDDNRINIKLHQIWETLDTKILYDSELLYLGFIPLTDDCSMWNYSLVSQCLSEHIYKAHNFWGLFAYSPSSELMQEVIDTYQQSFPMELDRYFVNHIQPRGNSIGISPQLFAADDGPSDNSGRYELNMLERSTDARFSKLTDYI